MEQVTEQAEIVTTTQGIECVFRGGAFVEVVNVNAYPTRGNRVWLHKAAAVEVALEILKRMA